MNMQNDPKFQNDLSKVKEKISEIEEKSADGNYIYRGEPEHYEDPPYCGRVSSNLWRELDAVKAKYSDIKEVQAEIVADVKEREDNKTDDFEILTALQHYGGKTNLIDFTTDYNVALFFACYGSPGEDGRVIILQKTEEAKKMLKYPQKPENRVRAQKSVFVEPPKGYIEQKYEVIRIPKDLKLLMLQYLRENLPYEISPKTIYNDIHGFIRSHNDNWLAYRDFDNGLDSQNRANQANTLEEKRKACEEAIKYYTNVLEHNLHVPTVYNNRGNAYSDIGAFERAIEDYNIVIQLKPDDAVAHYNRGLAYGVKCEYEDAIKDFNMAIQLNPDLTVAYYSRGVAYKNKRENNLAIADFTKAIELNPDYAEAYINRAIAYNNKKKSDLAIADFTKVIELNPDNAEAFYGRGVTYGIKGKPDHAIKDFNTAIALNPDYVYAYYDRGVAYAVKGEPDHAIKDFNTAIKLNPKYAKAYNNRGAAYNSKKESNQAIEDCNRAIELNPNYAEAYHNRGVAYGDKNEFDRAIKEFTKAIELSPKYAVAYNNRGVVYREMFEVDGSAEISVVYAIEDFTKAIQLKPDYAIAYYNRGVTWLHLKEWEKARSDLTTAQNMRTDIIALFRTLCASVTDFEQRNGLKLPADIAVMLTPPPA